MNSFVTTQLLQAKMDDSYFRPLFSLDELENDQSIDDIMNENNYIINNSTNTGTRNNQDNIYRTDLESQFEYNPFNEYEICEYISYLKNINDEESNTSQPTIRKMYEDVVINILRDDTCFKTFINKYIPEDCNVISDSFIYTDGNILLEIIYIIRDGNIKILCVRYLSEKEIEEVKSRATLDFNGQKKIYVNKDTFFDPNTFKLKRHSC